VAVLFVLLFLIFFFLISAGRVCATFSGCVSFVLYTENLRMATGTVKWFNTTKGYGFIRPEDGTKDVFVHISAVERAGLGSLTEGQRLNFELARGRDGRASAANLQILD